MENIKFIDISKLQEEAFGNLKNIIGLDSQNDVIKAAKQDSYTKEEIDELLKDSEISADKLQNKIKINSASTDYVVTQPTVSGDSLVITDAISDKNQYHTIGFDKTVNTTEIGNVQKYVDFNGDLDSGGEPIINTNFDNYENIPLDFSNITDDGDVDIIYISGSFKNFENGTEGSHFSANITYNKNTKIFKASDNDDITMYQFTRSDTGEYIFQTRDKQFDCNQLQDGAYLIWNIHISPGLYYRFYASTYGKLFVGEISATTPTSRFPHKKNEFFRYENGVKAYILTDKNTTFKTINGEQILGNGNIEVSANVDLSNYYTKLQTNKLVYPKLEQVTLTQAEYDALQTKENNVLYVISDAEDIKFKTINGQQITGNGDITIDTNVDLSNYATKSELATKQDVISDLQTIRSGAAKGATALQSVPSGYATEQWVNEQGFLKEHQDISNLATKSELNTKQDVISDLDTIRSGAAKGATALQSVPTGYATEQWVNSQGFLKEHQDISNLATKQELATKQDVITDLETIRSGAALGSTALQSVPSEYALKSEIPDITTKQDKLVSGENIKTVNGTSLLGSGNIEINASADNVPTVQTTPKGTTSNYIYSTGIFDGYGVISDISNVIKYSTDKASISTWKQYWGEEASYSHQSWSINAATTSQAGLMSASDKTKLDGIDLSTKQDTLVSGTSIKTVNGTSLLGSGNIEIAKEWIGTQAQYDALSTKDNNTTYYITE